MDGFVSKAVDVSEVLLERIRRAISFDLSQERVARCVVIVILYFMVLRPWMLKLAEKEGEKQLAAMEQRDKDKRDKEQQEQTVNHLRTGKKATPDAEMAISSASGSLPANGSAEQKTRQRTSDRADTELMTADEVIARNLENWDEDQAFLKNFARSSDRSHA